MARHFPDMLLKKFKKKGLEDEPPCEMEVYALACWTTNPGGFRFWLTGSIWGRHRRRNSFQNLGLL